MILKWIGTILCLLLLAQSSYSQYTEQRSIKNLSIKVGTVRGKRIYGDRLYVSVFDNCRTNRQFLLGDPSDYDFIEFGDFVVLMCLSQKCWLKQVWPGPHDCPSALAEYVEG